MKTILFAALLGILFGTYLKLHAPAEAAVEETRGKIIGQVYIRGAFDDGMAAMVGAQIQSLNESGADEIVIHITSPGGSVYAGLQIYDYMRLSKAPIRTTCEGYCMSMGAYLLSWGNVRQSDEHATIMFHQVGSRAQGKISEIENDLRESKRLQSILNDITREHSGMSTHDLEEMESYDNYMSPWQAKKLNLLDVVR